MKAYLKSGLVLEGTPEEIKKYCFVERAIKAVATKNLRSGRKRRKRRSRNGKKCVICGKPLLGIQKKTCSRKCKNKLLVKNHQDWLNQ